MITAWVRVQRITQDHVWVIPLESGGCGRCDEPGGCGSARLLSTRIGSRAFPVSGRCDVQVGARIRVGIQRRVLWQATFFAYILTTLLIIAGGLVGAAVQPGDFSVLGGAVFGLVVALGINRIWLHYRTETGLVLLPSADCTHPVYECA